MQFVPLVNTENRAQYLIPNADTGQMLSREWTVADFEIGLRGDTWLEGHGNFGFGSDIVDTELGSAMSGVNASAFVRYDCHLDDPLGLSGLRLRMRADDGFVAYLNGHRVAVRNAGIDGDQPEYPISLFRFDETASSVAVDATGQWPEAVLLGFDGNDSPWGSGQVGWGVLLDGVDDWLSAQSPIADGATEMTFSGWVRADSHSSWGTIVKNWGQSKTGQFHFGLQFRREYSNLLSDGKLLLEDDGAQLPLGNMLHLLSMESSTISIATAKSRTPLTQSNPVLGVGAKPNNDGSVPSRTRTGHWHGAFDEFAFWDTALTPAQIGFIHG